MRGILKWTCVFITNGGEVAGLGMGSIYISSPIPVKVYKAFDVSCLIKGNLAWIFHRTLMGFILVLYCCVSTNKLANIPCRTKILAPFPWLMNLQSGQTSGLCSTWHFLGQREGRARIIWRLTHAWLVPRRGRHKQLGAVYVIWPLYDNMAASRWLDFMLVGSG